MFYIESVFVYVLILFVIYFALVNSNAKNEQIICFHLKANGNLIHTADYSTLKKAMHHGI